MSCHQKIDLLRKKLQLHQIDAYIVPQADCHQNEYLPSDSERLTWLTDFTGSAGLAIVGKTQACLFVDGRYTLQVHQQTDPTIYTSRPQTWSQIEGWITDHMHSGQTLGFDPWLLTETDVKSFQNMCQKHQIQCQPIYENLIDDIWWDRPRSSQAPIQIWPISRSGISISDKLTLIAKDLQTLKVDVALLSQIDSINWLLNIRGGDISKFPVVLTYALIHWDATVDLFIDLSKVSDDIKAHFGQKVRLHRYEDFFGVLKSSYLEDKKIAIDPESASYATLLHLEKSNVDIIRAPNVCALHQAIKNQAEVEGAVQAHQMDAVAVINFLAWLDNAIQHSIVTELDIVRKIAQCRLEQGCQQESFGTISGSGPNGAIVHYQPTVLSNRTLNSNELFLIDSGGHYHQGTTDITRTIVFGRPSLEQKDRFTRVLKGLILLSSACFPVGTSGHQLDALARYFLWQQGLNYSHGTGHGVGSYLCVHEGPNCISSKPSPVALQPGMITSIEPGYYKANAYGIRLENLTVVETCPQSDTQETPMLRFKTLTLVPIDQKLMDFDLLNNSEKQWIDAYHQMIFKTLSHKVHPSAKIWLKLATQPLIGS